jgi:hypothetical protein
VPTPSQCGESKPFYLPEFIHRFLPERSQLDDVLEPRHFSRQRRFTLVVTISLLLNMVRPGLRDGYQKVIDRFFSHTHEGDSHKAPDQAAFARARKKLPRAVLEELFDKGVTAAQALAATSTALLWKGMRVFAIDGTKKNLPDSQELRNYFGASEEAHFPQMITAVLFDVLAKLPINFVRGPFNTPERDLAMELLDDLSPADLLIMDRGFPAYWLFHEIIERGIEFLVRLPKDGKFKEVGTFLKSRKRDGLVTLKPPKDLLKEHPELLPLTLRVLKIRLPGAKDPLILITTLRSTERYSSDQLSDLYHLRWREEEFFKAVKGHLQAEHFHGRSVDFVDQELIATYLYYLLTRIMILETASAYHIPQDHIETKAALLAVSRYLDRLWLAHSLDQCAALLVQCLREISWRRYRPRPGRSYPRRSKSHFGKWALKWR